MSWFEEQINSRRESDRESLNDAYEEAVNAVIGANFSFEETRTELDRILRYYHLPQVKIHEKITDENEKLSAMCRISGLMRRAVCFEPGWYRRTFGAYLCTRVDNQQMVAVIQDRIGRYYFYDPEHHKKVYMNRKTENLLEKDALCFYKPFPNKKLSIIEVAKFGLESWNLTDYLFTWLFLALATLVGLLVPKISYFLYSTVIENGSTSLLISTIIFMFSVSASALFLNSLQTIFNSRTSVKMGAALESATMMRTLSLPMNFFRKYSSGEISSRMSYINSVGTEIVTMIFSTSLSGVFSLAYITQIFKYAPSLVIPSLCIIAVTELFSIYSTFRQMKISKIQMEIAAKNSNLGIEMISGIQKIKLSGSEKRIFARYTKSFAKQIRVMYNPPLFHKYNAVITSLITYAGTLILYYFAIKSSVSVAEYYAFQTSYGMISAAIASLSGIALEMANLKPSIEMAEPILKTLPETDETAQDVADLTGNIELCNVTFSYNENGPKIIDDLSLKIRKGQYIAIVGKTGCGKSTLVRLLLGFEKPTKGAIYYDGRDLAVLEKKSLRRKIGTVIQDDKLAKGDIYSNIVLCDPSLTLAQAWEAAETAGIADDIRNMPMGMNTLITEGNGNISGGQRQRLAIARAIAPKPKVLIFDEATSALDNITQKKISDALDSLACTRIVIAHRLSTIRHCDRILVLDHGKITADGTYDELMENSEYFAELVNRQKL